MGREHMKVVHKLLDESTADAYLCCFLRFQVGFANHPFVSVHPGTAQAERMIRRIYVTHLDLSWEHEEPKDVMPQPSTWVGGIFLNENSWFVSGQKH
jgi:hypothetical protein